MANTANTPVFQSFPKGNGSGKKDLKTSTQQEEITITLTRHMALTPTLLLPQMPAAKQAAFCRAASSAEDEEGRLEEGLCPAVISHPTRTLAKPAA